MANSGVWGWSGKRIILPFARAACPSIVCRHLMVYNRERCPARDWPGMPFAHLSRYLPASLSLSRRWTVRCDCRDWPRIRGGISSAMRRWWDGHGLVGAPPAIGGWGMTTACFRPVRSAMTVTSPPAPICRRRTRRKSGRAGRRRWLRRDAPTGGEVFDQRFPGAVGRAPAPGRPAAGASAFSRLDLPALGGPVSAP